MSVPAHASKPYLLLGEAPGRTPGPPIGGRIGARLAACAGIEDVRERFDVGNVLDEFPGSLGKGTYFPESAAKTRMRKLMPHLASWRGVVLLGYRLANVVVPASHPVLAWIEVHRVRFAVIPHPSGINQWWNDGRHVAAASRFLSELAAESIGSTT